MKKIYFAGSIRGGRDYAQLYQKMIAYIQQKQAVVLTEHVGDLSKSTFEHKVNSEEDIYLQDTGWLKECDLVIAECSCPSLGVGYEVAFAEHLQKPVYIFYQESKCTLSAMLKGNASFHLCPYQNEDDVYPILDEILK